MQIAALVAANKQRWSTAHFKQSRWTAAEAVAKRLCAPKAKAIYEKLEQVTTVPWWVIALIHEREASQRWDRNIAQGDPFNKVSKHTPKGRGPFGSFSEAAIDALVNCAPHASKWKDWTAGGALTLLELYNGEGYENYHHMASPYLWAGTFAYIRGKYTSDGHFDAHAVDTQLGCAIMLRAMMTIDPSILASDETFGPTHGEEAQVEEPDPNEYPDASEEPEAHPAAPEVSEAEDTPEEDTPEDVPTPETKPLIKSKISNTQIGMGVGGAGMVFSQISDSFQDVIGHVRDAKDQLSSLGLWSIVEHAATKPSFWFGIVIVAGAAATIYWRWKDHGKGQTK